MSSGDRAATLWTNGTPQQLSNYASSAFDIKKVGSDIYIAGFENSVPDPADPGEYISVATYWKNGNKVALSDGSKHAFAFGIAVHGTDVYVAGMERQPTGIYKARLWKNGSLVALTSGAYNSAADDVTVDGNDVYAIYGESTTTTRAYLWKNGASEELHSTSTSYTHAKKVLVDNGNVYVVGEYKGASSLYQPCYWKNGIFYPLDFPTTGIHAINDFYIENGNLFITGSGYVSGSYSAFYYENNTLHVIDASSSPSQVFANSIANVNGNITVVGAANVHPVKWVNGTETVYSDKKGAFNKIIYE
ncbi:MAG: hypothetical protein KDD21_11075 [Bacteroidetes bacterium]|nr:hypothetical protein [Bacteroidota bacterium]